MRKRVLSSIILAIAIVLSSFPVYAIDTAMSDSSVTQEQSEDQEPGETESSVHDDTDLDISEPEEVTIVPIITPEDTESSMPEASEPDIIVIDDLPDTDDSSKNDDTSSEVENPGKDKPDKDDDANKNTIQPVENVFSDIRKTDWWYTAVQYAWGDVPLFKGTSDTKFSPRAAMTRGMFVTVLGRKSGIDVSSYSSCNFIDVKKDMWYAPYIQWANENGIINGVSTYKFDPDVSISRQDIVTILYRYAKLTGNDSSYNNSSINTFPDKNKISSYAVDAMKWAVSKGGISGYGSPQRLYPKDTSTRAQIAQIFYNFHYTLTSKTIVPPAAKTTSRDITVISHRSSPSAGSMHSFQSYDNAISNGSNYIEQDLHISADGVLVVSYMAELSKMTKGAYVGNIETMKWSDIKLTTLENGEHIHSLEEVFQRYSKRVNYVVETRKSSRHGYKAEDQLISLISRYGFQNNVIIQSFSYSSLRYIKRNAPGLKTMLLFDVDRSLSTVSSEIMNSSYVDIYCPAYYSITPDFISSVHKKNKKVYVYFLDRIPGYTETRLNLCKAIDMGIDGFFVDDTAQAMHVLANMQ